MVGPYAVDVFIFAHYMEGHPVATYTINDGVSCALIVLYRRNSRGFCVGVWYNMYHDGVPAHGNIHLMVK